MTQSNMEILDTGFDYLVEKLGVINAERFITIVKTDDFDYTKWRRIYFGNKTIKELNAAAVAHSEENPHTGKGAVI